MHDFGPVDVDYEKENILQYSSHTAEQAQADIVANFLLLFDSSYRPPRESAWPLSLWLKVNNVLYRVSSRCPPVLQQSFRLNNLSGLEVSNFTIGLGMQSLSSLGAGT